MENEQTRKKLVQFLDERVFDPILRKPERGYDQAQRARLAHLKRTIDAERYRYFEKYRTPEEVRQNFITDLQSRTGQRVSDELAQLGLPTLSSVKDEFLRLCDDHGVERD